MARRLFLIFLGILIAFANALPTTESSLELNIQNAIYKIATQFNQLLFEGAQPEGNILHSPVNIYTALALMHLGATGVTRDELSAFLGFSEADGNDFQQKHEKLGQILEDIQKTELANVSIANGLFAQKGLKVKDLYLEGSKKYYKSEAQLVDFAKGGSEATDLVNRWVSDKTYHRISKLFASPISPNTRLLLASALYFSATWSNKFSDTATKLEKFNTGVKEIDVQTMNAKKIIPYKNIPALQSEAISLPYLSGEYSMLIVLPYANHSLAKLVDTLNPEHYQRVIKDISSQRVYVDYKIPRLKFAWSQSINQQIIGLGVKKIFSNAELGNLIEKEQLSVSDVTHATEIEVNEDGTIATAVTVIQFVRTSLQIEFEQPIPFYVNRPFAFSIFHRGTGVILFSGIVQNPAKDV